jgi:hypothetical protein
LLNRASNVLGLAAFTLAACLALTRTPSGSTGFDWLISPLIVVVVVLGIFVGATAQAAAKHPPVYRTLRSSSSIGIDEAPDVVWNFLMAPGTSTLINPRVLQENRLEGTPRGVGEQVAMIVEGPDGAPYAHVSEIIEAANGRIRARGVSGPPTSETWELQTTPAGGTLATLELEAPFLRYRAHLRSPRKVVDEQIAQGLSALKRVLEAPAPPS